MGEQNEERDRESEKDRYFLVACNVMAYALFCFRLPIFNIILFVCFFRAFFFSNKKQTHASTIQEILAKLNQTHFFQS